DGDEDDLVAGFEASVAVDDDAAEEGPAVFGLAGDGFELAPGHGGVVLQRHGGDGLVAREVAHEAGEGDERADVCSPGVCGGAAQAVQFVGDVESFGLDADYDHGSLKRR